MKKFGLGDIKLQIQNYGIRISTGIREELIEKYNVPHLCYDKIFLYIYDNNDNRYPVYTFVSDDMTAFILTLNNDGRFVLLKNEINFEVSFDFKIDEYTESINGTKLSNIACVEANDHLAVTINHFCMYFYKGIECKFCSIKSWSDNSNVSINDKLEAIKKYANNDNVKHISITTGTTNEHDKGLKSIIEFCKKIRDNGILLPIAVEFEPVKDFCLLDKLYELGVTTVSINIEFLQEDMRRLLMPGKGKVDYALYKENWHMQ